MITVEYWVTNKDKKINSTNALDFFIQKNLLKDIKGKTVVTINLTMVAMSLIKDNSVYAFSDNKNYVDQFNKRFSSEEKYKCDDQAIFCSFEPGNSNNSLPDGCIYIIEEFNKMKEKKLHIDHVICNLPYGKVYIKMLIEMMKYMDADMIDNITAINPATPWNSKQYYALHTDECKTLFKHFDVSKSEIIDHDTFCKKIFNIGNAVPGNGIIAHFNKDINNESENVINDFLFEKDEIFKNILVKIANKKNKAINTVVGIRSNNPTSQKRADVKRYSEYLSMNCYSRIYTWHITDDYKDSILCKTDKAGSIIGFNTENEKNNFENSLKSWVYKIIFDACKDDLAKVVCLAPWLCDYTEPWTDEKLFEYFKLSESEISYIKEYMKN